MTLVIDQQKIFKRGSLYDPIMQAAAEAGLYPISVDHFFITTKKGSYKLPSNVSEWIENYDDGRNVRPISFEVELVG